MSTTAAPWHRESGWDDVVVGAGSAGSVLAARLSENPDRKVLLLEAGDAPRPPVPPLGRPVLDGANWPYTAALSGAGTTASRQFPYPVGKVLGGSSAVNGAIALRGLPEDFAEWATAGNPEWAWDRVLPFFKRLECDAGAGAGIYASEHGRDGPVPISRPQPETLSPAAAAFMATCRSIGMPVIADLNGATGRTAGVGLIPANERAGRRVSAADAYLTPAAARDNLTVAVSAAAHRVIVKGGRVTGVEYTYQGQRLTASADRVTLAAGAINTPVILERSGIGDADRIRRLGGRCLVDLPGVGENLAEHPAVPIWSVAAPGSARDTDAWHQVLARVAIDGIAPDVNLLLVNNVVDAPIPVIGSVLGGRRGVCLCPLLVAPLGRGSVHAADLDGDAMPVIELPLATEEADVRRLMTAARLAWTVLRGKPFGALVDQTIVWTDRMVSDEKLLRSAVTRMVTPTWHPAATARIGPDSDPLAVLDQFCRVRGVDGLRVADASAMPSITRAPTNLTCMMLAERVAAWMA